MTIGTVAKQAGVTVDTIRFYEKQGLLAPRRRRASGYREYDGEAVRRLRFIRRAKDLGFTLGDIRELLALKVDRRASCARVKRRAEAKITEIEEKIRTLRKMKNALARLTRACDERAPTSECPILDALEQGENV
ncbi:MAG: heavy metal-responsive transcriptional regulator [Deltaproteobacteria bacterium]|nr:MAG: heavy metal-responsive transcriptional regulator [Deltaproteobacteria bacterium]